MEVWTKSFNAVSESTISYCIIFSPVYTEEQLKRGHPLVDSNLHFLRNIAIHFTYIGFSYSYCIVVCRHVMIVFT